MILLSRFENRGCLGLEIGVSPLSYLRPPVVLSNLKKRFMDYLHALPIEIWREIIMQIPTEWCMRLREEDDPFDFLQANNARNKQRFKLAMDTMAFRASLLTTCRTLYPVVEELLYSQLFLRSLDVVDMYQRLSKKREDGKYPGIWTRLVLILIDRDTKWARGSPGIGQTSKIKSVCPNLEAIHILFIPSDRNSALEDEMIIEHIHKSWVDGSSSPLGLNTLNLSGFAIWNRQFTAIITTNPIRSSLTHLVVKLRWISYVSTNHISDCEIYLPSLQTLKLCTISSHTANLKLWTTPSLTWFSVERSPMDSNVFPFLSKIGKHLRGLEVDYLYANDTEKFKFRDTFLALQTFIFDSDQLNLEHLHALFPVNTDASNPSTQCYKLRRLAVNCHDFAEEYAHETIEDLGKFFSLHRFPNLEEIIFFRTYEDHDSGWWIKDIPTLLAEGMRAFPLASIRVRRDLA